VNTVSPRFAVLRFAALLLFGGAGTLAANAAEPMSRWATLEAIHRLENPRNLTRPGPYGELGAYQFRAATWRMHTTEPFHRALDREAADRVAVKHYEWLKRGLERAGVPATAYNIALAWNGGLSATINRRAPRVAHDYAQRAENIAGVISARTSIVAAAE
jgi:hypothetical protein